LSSTHISNAGGGGERVLFTAIAQLQRDEAHVVCVVYTGDLVGSEAIISNTKVRPHTRQIQATNPWG
jgi:alpha-1,2-mannosyltransferase